MSEKKQDIWSAIGKLKARDQIVLLFAVVLIVCSIAGVFFYFIFGLYMPIKFHITESTLRKTPTGQVYRQTTYTDYPYVVSFPGTNYATMVGGKEYLYNDFASSFLYDENHLLILGVFDNNVPINEFYSRALAAVIDKNIDASQVVYSSIVHDEGYLNTLPLLYEGGKLSTPKEYYLVSYLFHTEDGKYLLMMCLTDKKGQQEINKAKKLVDKMVYAMSRIEDSEQGAEIDNSESKKKDSDSYALDENAEKNMTTKEKMEYLDRKRNEANYALEYPDAVDLEYNVLVSERIPKAIFYIDYTEVESIPKIAYIMSPSGVKYAPSFNNGNKVGMIYWEIDDPEEGNWLIHLSKNTRYGQFFAGVVSDVQFEELYGEKSDPQPRNGQ